MDKIQDSESTVSEDNCDSGIPVSSSSSAKDISIQMKATGKDSNSLALLSQQPHPFDTSARLKRKSGTGSDPFTKRQKQDVGPEGVVTTTATLPQAIASPLTQPRQQQHPFVNTQPGMMTLPAARLQGQTALSAAIPGLNPNLPALNYPNQLLDLPLPQPQLQSTSTQQLLLDQYARTQAVNPMFLMQPQQPQPMLDLQSLAANSNLLQSLQQQQQQLAALQSLAGLQQVAMAPAAASLPNLYASRGVAPSTDTTNTAPDISMVLRQMQQQQQLASLGMATTPQATTLLQPAQPAAGLPPMAAPKLPEPTPLDTTTIVNTNDEVLQNPLAPGESLNLPLCFEGTVPTNRSIFPLGIDEDPNWLSEFHCFVRNDLTEVFCASSSDVRERNNAISNHQVGIRCRFCAHMPANSRAGRSSAFPSSLRQIYQSFTMMLRDHFVNCECMPADKLQKFLMLKEKPSQGATDSKRFWMFAAMKIGMIDTDEGIKITPQSRLQGENAPPFGTTINQPWPDEVYKSVRLVTAADNSGGGNAEFLHLLMSQVQPIRLSKVECIGNRRSLRQGLPGFGCRFCCEDKRLGLCRMFPARRRTLPSKVNDLYDHLRRCTRCPENVKKALVAARPGVSNFMADQGSDREFFDRVWRRLGHDSQSA